MRRKPLARFESTFCSQCGAEFGPGDHGFSHCSDHRPKVESPDIFTIKVRHEKPPISDRGFEWIAVTDDYEPPQPIGYGGTKWNAIADLVKQLEDYYD
jgi:hypothetical protein